MTGFSERQIRALNRRVPPRNIKLRLHDGKQLSYIEGWYAFDQANRIFGFDHWDRETVEIRCIHAHQDRSGGAAAIYSARVRVTVRTESATVVRDGHGTGDAKANSLGEAHDRALKAAETDATKRALATFGRAFGLALYAGSKPANPEVPTNSAGVAAVDAVPAPETNGGRGQAARIGGDGPSSHMPLEGQARQAQAAGNAPSTRTRIDKSTLTFAEPKRIRDKDHLRFVASQPCLLCGKTPCDAHHIGFAQPRALARKVSDEFTVPLCRAHHAELHHEGNEIAWWHDMGIEPLAVARELWADGQKSPPAPGLSERAAPMATLDAGSQAGLPPRKEG